MSKYSHLNQSFDQVLAEAKKSSTLKSYLEGLEVALGDMVMNRRYELGYTQQRLAELAGISVDDISIIEGACTHWSFGLSLQDAEAFGKVFKALGIVGLTPIINSELINK
ncbi:hypothetical protein QCD85_06025 [Paenibacillus sp. PsM32]|uniref:hypothetical protein n=1 Tax=unclassified Paenibacillus TaxID=185978 RepID=UPI002365678C|nr:MULTISPECIES: hypothetical protein [unclassified Paenibacillus]MDN4617647.1 hypothetical protein [Paenibacillus sp. PsM32]WDF52897.1 hypothetical protein PQ460_10925 [Paenibacillus sp. KACC 21273]